MENIRKQHAINALHYIFPVELFQFSIKRFTWVTWHFIYWFLFPASHTRWFNIVAHSFLVASMSTEFRLFFSMEIVYKNFGEKNLNLILYSNRRLKGVFFPSAANICAFHAKYSIKNANIFFPSLCQFHFVTLTYIDFSKFHTTFRLIWCYRSTLKASLNTLCGIKMQSYRLLKLNQWRRFRNENAI